MDDKVLKTQVAKIKNSHIVGTCLGCKKSHDGVLSITIDAGKLYVGVSDSEGFHPFEGINLDELRQ